MKFMKLGSRPDTFHTADDVRSVCSEVSSDLTVQVKGTRYLLHKFPLLSKCLKLQKLCSESPESSSLQHQIIQLTDFPGGTESFELCAKFCYGMTIHISSYNIVSIRCAAEYLQMTEDVEQGNLIYKLEVFFNSCILSGWRDSIVTLQSTKAFSFLSEDLKITSRCIESIASKVLKNPSKNKYSRSLSRKGTKDDNVSCNGTSRGYYWAEDIAELGIDLYWRTMIVIKSGKIPPDSIGDALNIYASRWLLNISQDVDDNKQEKNSKNRLLLESIVSLLPNERGSVSCRFLCKLLKAANILNASSSPKIELARRIGIQLEEAKISDLLIPSQTLYKNDTIYDVDIVLAILEQFMLQGQSPPTSPLKVRGGGGDGFQRRRSRSAENIDFQFQESRRSSSASHSAKLKVAKLVDGYLQEIASDVNLPLSKMISISEVIPAFARLDHDDLYRAIDIYLKAHPDLNKSERKRLCQVLDCKKLSMQACIHAAQNELLPLRVVVQVLFFEQARAALAGGQVNDLPKNIKALLSAHKIDPSTQPSVRSTTTSIQAEDQWSVSGLKSPKSKLSTLRMKLDEDDNDLDEHGLHDRDGMGRPSRFKSFCAIPTRPKRMLSKLWSTKGSGSEKS